MEKVPGCSGTASKVMREYGHPEPGFRVCVAKDDTPLVEKMNGAGEI